MNKRQVYQIVKGISLRKKLKLINTISEKGKLLDIGAGTGDFLTVAKKNYWNVIGIEPNEKAKSISTSKGVALANDLKTLDNNSFDVITMGHVLEHVPNLE